MKEEFLENYFSFNIFLGMLGVWEENRKNLLIWKTLNKRNGSKNDFWGWSPLNWVLNSKIFFSLGKNHLTIEKSSKKWALWSLNFVFKETFSGLLNDVCHQKLFFRKNISESFEFSLKYTAIFSFKAQRFLTKFFSVSCYIANFFLTVHWVYIHHIRRH